MPGGRRNGRPQERLERSGGLILLAALDGVDGGIEKLAFDLHSCQALLLDEMTERLLHFGVQVISQLMSIVALGRLVHENFHGGQQGSVTGEPDALMRPPCVIVEVSDFGQGVEAAAMGVAGEIVELLQFAKHGQIGFCAESAFQLGQISDLVTAKVLAQDGGIEGSGSHNVIVLTP